MDIIKNGFGKRLKKIRKAKNLTQEKLAEKIGINLRQLARIEAGESFITSETLLKICNALDILPQTLFDFDIQTVSKSLAKSEIDEQFENLQEKIISIAKDSQKLEFIEIAYDSLFNTNALNELKLLIKGIELSKS